MSMKTLIGVAVIAVIAVYINWRLQPECEVCALPVNCGEGTAQVAVTDQSGTVTGYECQVNEIMVECGDGTIALDGPAGTVDRDKRICVSKIMDCGDGTKKTTVEWDGPAGRVDRDACVGDPDWIP